MEIDLNRGHFFIKEINFIHIFPEVPRIS